MQGSSGETDIENRLMDMERGEERNMETYITICKIANGNLLYVSRNSNRLCINLDGWDRKVMGGRFRREEIYIYLWVIHVEI